MTEYEKLDPRQMNQPNLSLIEMHPGKHFWTLLCMYAIGEDPRGGHTMTKENMVGYQISCFHCEQPFTNELAATPCPGDPNPEAAAALEFLKYLSSPESGR